MNLSPNPELHLESQRIDSDLQAYLARGGQIERVPVGAMAEMGWTAKQRANPQVSTKAIREAEIAEREARKLAKASIPAPRSSERALPRAKAAKAGPKVCPEGSKTAAILAMLHDGPLTCHEIGIIKGWPLRTVMQAIRGLREQRLVVSAGKVRRPGQLPAIGWKAVKK